MNKEKSDKIKKTVKHYFSKNVKEYSQGICNMLSDKRHVNEIICLAKVKNQKLLDIACGTGIVSFEASKIAKNVVGIDISDAMIKRANKIKNKKKIKNIEFRVGDIENLSSDNEEFDSAIIRYGFHHFPNPVKVINELYKLLKPNGAVVLADIFVPDDKEIDVFMNNNQHPGHVRHYNLDETKKMFKKGNFNLEIVENWKLKFSMSEAKTYMGINEWKKWKSTLLNSSEKIRKFLKVKKVNNDVTWIEPGKIIKFRKV